MVLFQLAQRLQDHPDRVVLQGIYVHCGNSYAADSVLGVEKVKLPTRLGAVSER